MSKTFALIGACGYIAPRHLRAIKDTGHVLVAALDRSDLPAACAPGAPMTYRSIRVDGQEVEFSGGFTDLHTESYKQILAGAGFGWREVLPSLEIVHAIRHAVPVGCKGDVHPSLIGFKDHG